MANVDQYLFEMSGLWLKATAIYDAVAEAGEPAEVTADACDAVNLVEEGIRAFQAATVDGALIKLGIVERYLDPMEGDDGRASAMALSFARDCSAIIRTPGRLPVPA